MEFHRPHILQDIPGDTQTLGVGTYNYTFKKYTFKSVIFKSSHKWFLDHPKASKIFYTFGFYTFKNYTFESAHAHHANMPLHCL